MERRFGCVWLAEEEGRGERVGWMAKVVNEDSPCSPILQIGMVAD